MLQQTLMSLKPAPSTREDYSRVQETLLKTIGNEDAHVRRHAAYQVGEWATSNEDLAPLRDMVMYEEDINARARAIGSIAASSFRSEENKAALEYVVNNTGEWVVMREHALESLQLNYALSDNELLIYEALAEQLAEEVKQLQQ